MLNQESLHQATQIIAERLATAQRVVVLTGAGVSAESGVATFRDPDGLWQKFRPEELASMNGFLKNPNLVWQWYQARRDVLERVQPNAGHWALATLQRLLQERGRTFTLITQNVDRLHQRAGSTDVVELHGNIVENYCSRCTKPHHYVYSEHPEQQEPPRCEYCGGMIRPAVVWFGEMLPMEALAQAENAAEHAEIFFSIGTSAEVYPAAGLPRYAQQHGAFVVEINPTPTPLTRSVHLAVPAKSGEVLPFIVACLQRLWQTS